ncbi:MAG TPA: ABC transporter permease [Gemmatimonadaceae bacterium]
MELLLQDTRYAARKLARAPGFTLIVVATLSLAIGATTAMFSIVNGVLLNPLGFTRPDRLVFVEGTDPKGEPIPVSPQDMMDYRDRTHSFTGMAAVDGGRNVNLTRESAPAVRISAARVGASFFSLLGIRAQRGRTFAPGDDDASAAKIVVLSDAGWRRHFGADPRIVGQRITLDGNSYQVVGVAPPKFTYPASPDVWFPAVWRDYEIGDTHRGYRSINAIARLKDGATIESANRDVQSVAGRLAQAFPEHDARIGARLSPLRDRIIGNVARPLWAMLGAVALVLLIACANVANLLLVRAAARESEIAVRAALGAGSARLVQQLVTESMLLAVVGTVLGTLLASWAVGAVIAFGPADLPRLGEIGIDGRVLGFAALVAIVTGVGFGLLPALHVARSDISRLLRSGARGSTRGGNRTRHVLVLLELALGMVLLVGAGLLLKSFERLMHVNPGFRPDHLVVFDVALSGKKYEHDQETIAFVDDVQSRLAAIAGTQSAAVAADRPIDPNRGFELYTSFTVDGAAKLPQGTEPHSRILPVSPSLFETMRMSLVHGRTFTDAENRLDAAPVIVINEEMARRYFPGQNPIGKHLTFGLMHHVSAAPDDTVRARGEIVGVVRNVQHNSLDGKPDPATYVPFRTLPLGSAFLLRTSADPSTVERAIRSVVAAVDRNVPIYGLGTMDEALSDSVSQPRFYTLLLSTFAAVALLLSALGIYGVISYAATQRMREFGIRVALGATSHDVSRLVVRRGLFLTIAGIGGGIVIALLATRALQGLLFGVEALDIETFVSVALLLAAVAMLASWLPARRAARVDPVTAMRAD